jgi:NAD(P)-dependent dehydrogenase (short-subunit alcohol dehydrogenase family)
MAVTAMTRVAVVTGAASGIGQGLAVRLARDGARIVIADLGPADETMAMVEAIGGDAFAFACDVSSEEGVDALRDHVAEGFGRCDILVNNAGIYPYDWFRDVDFAKWRRMIGVNLDSVFLTCRAFLPGMCDAGWGRIVNISSNALWVGSDPKLAHYLASKAGVIGLTRGLATEYGPHGITVNSVAPGLVATPGTIKGVGGSPEENVGKWEQLRAMQSIPRTGTPADLAGAVAFLASDEAAYITGQTLVVDGGAVRL